MAPADEAGNEMEILQLDSFEPAVAIEPGADEEAQRRFSTLLVERGRAGAGGTGYVRRATNTAGEVFAVKRLHSVKDQGPRVASAMRAVLFEEYRNQLAVSHLKGFPHVYGYGTAAGEPLILMEWIDGITLKQATPHLPRTNGAVRADAVAAIGVAVLEILAGVERLDARLVHRDISPRNIMIRCDRTPFGRQISSLDFDVYLVDFGSSTAMQTSDPTFTTRADIWRNGTPDYAPPEMLTHDIAGLEQLRANPSIDVYALASVLYELYAGHTPFRLTERGGLSPYRIKTEYPIEDLAPRCPADRGLTRAIMSGICARQSLRPSPDELLQRLRAWMDGDRGDWPTLTPTNGEDESVTAPAVATGAVASAGAIAVAAAPVTAEASAATPTPAPTPAPVQTPVSPSPVPVSNAAASQSPRKRPVTRRALLALAGIGAATAVGGGLWLVFGRTDGSGDVSPAENDEGASEGIGSESPSLTDEPAPKTATVPDPYAPLIAAKSTDGTWGLVDTSGSWQVKATYADMGAYSEGLAAALDAETGLWGYINQDGEWVIRPSLKKAGIFHDGVACAQDDGTGFWGVLSPDSSWSAKPAFIDMGSRASGGLIAARKDSREDGWGYIDYTGSWKVRASSFTALGEWSSSAGLGPARIEGDLWGFIDEYGRWAVDPVYGGARGFTENRAVVQRKDTGDWNALLPDGTSAYNAVFSQMLPYLNAAAPAQDPSSGNWGLAGISGGWLVEPIFSSIGEGAACGNDFYFPAQDKDTQLWGCIEPSGNWRVTPRLAYVTLV